MKCQALVLLMMNKLDTKNKKHLEIKTCRNIVCKARVDVCVCVCFSNCKNYFSWVICTQERDSCSGLRSVGFHDELFQPRKQQQCLPITVIKTCALLLERWLCSSRHSQPNNTTCGICQESTGQKERAESCKLSSAFHGMHVLIHTYT